MLCLRTLPHHARLPTTVTLLRRRTAAVRMSTTTSTYDQIVEHFVLFKVKPTVDPTPMLANLNSLAALPTVIHISAVPVTRCSSPSLSFTHMLHSRYRSIPDLQSYSDHPDHVGVVTEYVRPSIEDILAVDFVSEEGFDASNPKISPGSGLRLTCVKLKEGVGEEGKREVLEVMKGLKGKLVGVGVEGLTVGENFSPGRAKGFGICSLAVVKGELEKLNEESSGEIMGKDKDKVREFLDQVLIVDCIVDDGSSSSSSNSSL